MPLKGFGIQSLINRFFIELALHFLFFSVVKKDDSMFFTWQLPFQFLQLFEKLLNNVELTQKLFK